MDACRNTAAEQGRYHIYRVPPIVGDLKEFVAFPTNDFGLVGGSWWMPPTSTSSWPLGKTQRP